MATTRKTSKTTAHAAKRIDPDSAEFTRFVKSQKDAETATAVYKALRAKGYATSVRHYRRIQDLMGYEAA